MPTTLSVLAWFALGLATPPQPDVSARLEQLASAHQAICERSSLGESRLGRALHLLRLADPAGSVPPDERPALLIVAGANAAHVVGIETALRVAEKLASEHADVLKQYTVYIVPCLNPDGLAKSAESPASGYSRTVSPFDADHDGRVGEDPGEDLNNDGLVTMMRVESPPPGSLLKADSAADPESPKLIRRADATKGEAVKYVLLPEGIDNDGDVKFNEDGPGGAGGGGVDLDMNTPYRWPEFADGAGPYQFSEPESLALARWMLARTNVVAAVFYGPHDNLVKVPEAGKFDDAGGVPLGIETGDKPYYEEMSKLFKDITKMTAAPSGDNAGSLHQWAYSMAGVYSFSTPVWVRPDLLKKEDPPKDGAKREGDGDKDDAGTPKADTPGETPPREGRRRGERGDPPPRDATPPPISGLVTVEEGDEHDHHEQPAAQPATGAQPGGRGGGGAPGGGQPGAGGGRGRFGGGGGAPGGEGAGGGKAADNSEDAKWIKYSDESRGGEGFVDWKPFEHSQLGHVEIGGFVPGFRMNPPESEHPRLAEEQTKFIAALLGKFPRVSGPTVVAERLAAGVWRISVRAVNDGYLPLQTAMAAKARRVAPARLTIDLPQDRILSGQKIARFPAVGGSGGPAETQWIVRVDDGRAVSIRYAPLTGGERVIEVPTENGGGR